MSRTERIGHRTRHVRFGFDDFGLHFLRVSAHFLLLGDCHRAALFRASLRNLFVCFRLIGLELGADISSDVHIGDIDGQNLKRRPGIEPFAQDGTGNVIRIFQDVRMALRRAAGRDDAFADARNDGCFPRAADETIDIRPHGHPRPDFELNSVLGDSGNHRRLDDFRIDAHLHGLEHVSSGQIDGGRLLKRQRDLRPMRRNQSIDDIVHVSAGQIMRFELIHVKSQPRLRPFDERQNNHRGRHAPDAHPNQIEKGNMDIGRQRRNPKSHRHKVEKDGQHENNQK